MLSVEYINYFLEACDCGSMQAASKKLHLSSQGLGAGIQRLEESIGLKLLNRSNSGVVPTKFGELFYEYASKVSGDMRALEELCTYYSKRQKTTISIGVIGSSIVNGIISICEADYNKDNPEDSIEIVSVRYSSGPEMIEALMKDEIEVAWLYQKDPLSNYESIQIDDFSPLVLICSKDHHFANRESISIPELESCRLIQGSSSDPFTNIIHEICEEYGVNERVAFYTMENSLVGKFIDCNVASILVRAGHSSSIMSACKHSVIVPILPEICIANSLVFKKSIGVRTKKRKFLDYMVDYVRNLLYE